ncbi:MAG: hypothetical protein QOE48_5585 [Mycobacterium sp.]|jgi:hypothetical protein|nr:hypothetical protein [Mycobacterium sp.]
MHSGANGVPEETKSSNATDTTQKRGKRFEALPVSDQR